MNVELRSGKASEAGAVELALAATTAAGREPGRSYALQAPDSFVFCYELVLWLVAYVASARPEA